MNEDPVIDVLGITKRFGEKTAVDEVDLRVDQGEIYGFLGPNGSGKTTFIRMLCGLLKPDDGSGTCLGYDILTEQTSIKRHVGYMTQRFSFYEDLSIRENLDFVARVYQISNRRRSVDASLERLGLSGRQRQLAGELSGGWKQRLALAACLIHQPKLLLLDEPTAGVDPKARRDFWEQIHALAAEGLTFTNAFLTASSCSPSRASIMTGRYPHNTGEASELHRPWAARLPTLPELLAAAGYYTAQAGKYHMSQH